MHPCYKMLMFCFRQAGHLLLCNLTIAMATSSTIHSGGCREKRSYYSKKYNTHDDSGLQTPAFSRQTYCKAKYCMVTVPKIYNFGYISILPSNPSFTNFSTLKVHINVKMLHFAAQLSQIQGSAHSGSTQPGSHAIYITANLLGMLFMWREVV